MKIWVDADACPNVIKEILFRLADRAKVMVTLVADQALSIPESNYIRAMQVMQGFDVADDEIVKRAEQGDIVITSDIPLADECITKECFVLSPRGEQFTKDTIKAKLTMRDFLDTLRGSGEQSGGPPPFSQTDRREFANQIDRLVAKPAISCMSPTSSR